jgi:hypothetical protein
MGSDEESQEDETFIAEDREGAIPLPHPVAEDQEAPPLETAPLPDEVAAIFAMEEEAVQDEPESSESEEVNYEMPDVVAASDIDDEESVLSNGRARQLNRKKRKEGNKRRF